MSDGPLQLYSSLMTVIRGRFDTIRQFKLVSNTSFESAELGAFQGRKIIEATAFGCLIAIDRGVRHVPKDAKGQWNAKTILRQLRSKGLNAFPSPSIIRPATEEEKKQFDVKITIEGVPDRRISVDALIEMYERMHKWLHEINPYVASRRDAFLLEHGTALGKDLENLENFLERHTISIAGEMMFCVLRDCIDNLTKVIPLSKIASLYPQQR